MADPKVVDKAVEKVTTGISNKELLDAITMGVALAAKQTAAAPPVAAKRVGLDPDSFQRCPACGQQVRACKYVAGDAYEKDHELAVVYPKNPKKAAWFQGVRLNNKLYRSAGPNHKIWIPKRSNVLGMVDRWESEEGHLQTPRSAEHFSGSIGSYGKGYIPANGKGWR